MLKLAIYSNHRVVWAAAIVSLQILTSGCAMWDRDRWDLNRYRDERAVDIDQRLSTDEPIVKSPF